MPRTNLNRSRAANGLGSLRQKTVIRNGKKYTYWEGRYTVGQDATGKQRQKSITGKTKAEVVQKLLQMSYEVNTGTYKEPSKMTLAEWMEIWTTDYLCDVKESSASSYRYDVNKYIVPHLGTITLKKLAGADIQRFYKELQKPAKPGVSPLAPKTVRDIHGVLHKALEQAVSLGYLRVNPSDACKAPRAVRKEIQPLDDMQIVDFLNLLPGHKHEYLYKITLFTGMREGEVLGLTWDSVDLMHNTLTVRQQLQRERKSGGKYFLTLPKHDKIRVLSIAPSVSDLFWKQKAKQEEMREKAGELWTENNLVFSNPTGGYLSYRTVYDCFKRLMVKIGSPDTRFHDLRHSYAVMALEAGDDIKTLQENLGHADAAFTLNVYGHVTAKMRRASAGRMERTIRGFAGLSAGMTLQ